MLIKYPFSHWDWSSLTQCNFNEKVISLLLQKSFFVRKGSNLKEICTVARSIQLINFSEKRHKLFLSKQRWILFSKQFSLVLIIFWQFGIFQHLVFSYPHKGSGHNWKLENTPAQSFSGRSRISRGEGQHLTIMSQPIIFQKFCRKLHKNERI